ncbi:MAG TPA: response regulator [Acidiferrobacteraceae bacterium]|nr:response regulator [Acidiferrobacteraceae bacterium]
MDAKKILVVDDSPTDLHLLSEILSKNGYSVVPAQSGEEAIELAKSEQPDLILMDIVMPGMNGFEATRAISKSPDTEAIPILIVSTKGQETDRVWGLRQGAKDYLVKPIDEQTLIGKIQSL